MTLNLELPEPFRSAQMQGARRMTPEAYTGRTLRMAAEEQRRRWALLGGSPKTRKQLKIQSPFNSKGGSIVYDFVRQNKIIFTAGLSIAIGLVWSYIYFCILWDYLPYRSWIHNHIEPHGILIAISTFIGLILGKNIKERMMLLIISAVCSVAMLYLFLILLFLSADLGI